MFLRMRTNLAFGLAATISAALIAISPGSYAKTVKACEEEWKANKATIQASGKKKKDFIAECRAETAATPAPTAPQTAPAPARPAQPTQAPAPRPTAAPSKANQYTTEAEAKSHCPGDTVVWANTNSKIYHFAGTHNYGNTKSGAYMCERDAGADGFRAPKNEKHP
jgi:hypothetical protein